MARLVRWVESPQLIQTLSDRSNRHPILLLLVLLFFLGSCTQEQPNWLQGNMHTHTFWSDGDDFPESVTRWYRENGYDFLVLTDHNLILEGERWRNFPEEHLALARYMAAYGDEWVETMPGDREGTVKVRLKALDEFRSLYEKPGEFLIIMGNEISNPHAVHVLAFHQDRVIPAVQGTAEERERMIHETVAGVDSYREQTGINTWPVLAHQIGRAHV